MTAVAMKVFLDELARRHDGQYILMIYDGAPCHSPGALNIPDTMTVRTLPPYSPQLNPVENIWDDMREKFFANIVFESMDAVENKISEAASTTRKKRKLSNPSRLSHGLLIIYRWRIGMRFRGIVDRRSATAHFFREGRCRPLERRIVASVRTFFNWS